MDLKDVTTATPVEIDTRLADLYRQEMRAKNGVEAALVRIRHANGERKDYTARRSGVWLVKAADAVAAARARGDERVPMLAGGYTFADMVAGYDEAARKLADILAQAEPLNAEFERRGGWSRFFVVQNHNGHIHSSMRCRTCNRGRTMTEFGWNPELSGMSQADALARFDKRAYILCSVCFPDAPLGWGDNAGGNKPGHCTGSRQKPIAGTVRRVGPRRYGDCQECTDRPLINADGTVRAHKPKEPREKTPPAAAAEETTPAPVPAAEETTAAPAPSPETATAGPGEILAEPTADALRMIQQIAAAPAGTVAVFDGAGVVDYVPAEEPAVEDAATAAAGETTTEPAAGVDLLPVPVSGAAAECRICRAVMVQTGPGGAWEAATPPTADRDHEHAAVQAVWADQWYARFYSDQFGALLVLVDEYAAKLSPLVPREADVERAAPPRAQLAAQLGALLSDPDLLRAAADEITRDRVRARIAAGPVVHAGRADNEHGVTRRILDGALSFDPYDGGEWRLAGHASTRDIEEDDTAGAQAWAAQMMADGDYDHDPVEVLGWEHHRDAYGEWWEPITG